MSDDTSWERFLEEFAEALDNCFDTGEQVRVTLGGKTRNVTIDIYPEGGTMKKFDEMILKAVKENTGVDLVKDQLALFDPGEDPGDMQH